METIMANIDKFEYIKNFKCLNKSKNKQEPKQTNKNNCNI